MARYSPFFQHGGMTPVQVPDDLKLEKAIGDLEEKTGLWELLVSKSLNLKYFDDWALKS